MFPLFFILAAVVHAQLQPTVFQASEVSTHEAPIVAIAKNSHTMVLSEETKRMVCDEFCHHLTTGECQQPNLGDDNCYMKLANNGTCPAGTVECGMRPAKEVPTGTLTAGDGKTYLDVPDGLLVDQPNHLIANDVSLPAYFKFGFKLTPRGQGDGTLVHFSKNDEQDCEVWGQCIPTIFFDHGSFETLIMDIGKDEYVLGYASGPSQIYADQTYDIECRILELGAQIFVNGVLIGESNSSVTREAFDNVRVWSGPTQFPLKPYPARAEISGLWFSDLSGDEEYPLGRA